ncbi:hypothetical protein JCM10449v2_002964 [Rhodotorula kratochvilovae]
MASSASQDNQLVTPFKPVVQTSKLLALPAELLDMIFEEVCAEWPGPGLICRALLRFHDQYHRKRFRRVKIVGSNQLASYCRSLRMRSSVGAMCKSFKLVHDERCDAPYVSLDYSDVSLLFASLPNVRNLEIVDDLVEGFLKLANSSEVTFMPRLAEISLNARLPGVRDPYHPSMLSGLAKFRRLEGMYLLLDVEDVSETLDEVKPEHDYTLNVQVLALVLEQVPPGAADILARCKLLREPAVVGPVQSITDARIIGAATLVGTLETVGLHAFTDDKVSWKVPKHLKKLTNLTTLVLGHGCTCRDVGSFDTLRRLPLERLYVRAGTVVSTAYLYTLLRGKGKIRSLKLVQLDNVVADLGNVMRLKWPNDRRELDKWLHGGWVLPKWTKTFSREGVEALMEASEVSGVQLTGSAVEAPRIEDLIKEKKGWVKLKKRLRRKKKGHRRKVSSW